MKKLLIYLVLATAITVFMAGCGKGKNSEHPTSEHPAPDHAASEHPATENLVSVPPFVEQANY